MVGTSVAFHISISKSCQDKHYPDKDWPTFTVEFELCNNQTIDADSQTVKPLCTMCAWPFIKENIMKYAGHVFSKCK